MTLKKEATAAMLQSKLLQLANRLANLTDYEAAGIVLRASHLPVLLPADPRLTRVLHWLLVEARDATNFPATREEIMDVLRAVEALANVFEEEAA